MLFDNGGIMVEERQEVADLCDSDMSPGWNMQDAYLLPCD